MNELKSTVKILNLKIFFSILFFSLIYYLVPYSARPDFANYVYTYKYLPYVVTVQHFGPGFSGLISLFRSLNFEATFFYFCMFLFSTYLFLRVIYVSSDSYIFSLFLFLIWIFPLEELITIAAGMAAAIFMLSINDIWIRRKFAYFSKVALAISMHYSAIIFIPLYFISPKKINRTLYFFIIITSLFAALLSEQIIQLLSLVMDYFPTVIQMKFSVYASNYHEGETHILNSKSLLFSAFALYAVYVSKKFYRSIDIVCLKIFVLGVISFYYLSFSPVFAYRVLELLTPIFVVLLPNIFRYINIIEKLYLMVVVFIISIYYVYSISGLFKF